MNYYATKHADTGRITAVYCEGCVHPDDLETGQAQEIELDILTLQYFPSCECGEILEDLNKRCGEDLK